MFIVFFLTEAFYCSVDPWTCAERAWCNGSELLAARYKALAMKSRLFFRTLEHRYFTRQVYS